jgi:Recombination endonuclease VII
MGLKRCTKCEQDKDEKDDFHKDSRTGKPRSWCKLCTNADNIARAAANPEKHNARSKAWRDANPERWSATVRAWGLRNPEKLEASRHRSQYKIEFEALWQAQNGMCASCHEPMLRDGKEVNSVCVDHDRSCCPGHKSCGKCVRGLIHRNCNLVLGYAKDNVRVLQCAIEYLERWRLREPENGSEFLFMRPQEQP